VVDSAALLSIFGNDLLPIFAIAAAGYAIARLTAANVRTVSTITFNALAPCLVFNLLVTSTISKADFGRMALFCVLVTAAAGLFARLAAIPLRMDRPTLIAFVLVVMFSNSGNYGLPVALFAFGRDALARATNYFVTSSILTYTFGIVLAASGRRSIGSALANVLRVPTMYAVVAAVAVLGLHVAVPAVVMRPVAMLSDAALPIMILVLGMQLERATMPERPSVVATAVALSLIVTPAAAIALAVLLRLHGTTLQAAVMQASMPAAVVTTILALEYDVAPSFVTSVVVVSTALSPFTLTWLIAYLQAG
jgi:predicted permease